LESAPESDKADALVVTVVLKPALTATEVPERMFSDWHDVWASGIKARMMVMPGKSWSQPQLGLMYGQRYESGIAKAIFEVKRGRTSRTLYVKPKFKFA
jgi:hypothetical protein